MLPSNLQYDNQMARSAHLFGPSIFSSAMATMRDDGDKDQTPPPPPPPDEDEPPMTGPTE